ncbi:MAG: hypothetical protein E7221_07480 [Clostridiales bacterium]|nr:hypothetical protein [Clostridiales bacterium]
MNINEFTAFAVEEVLKCLPEEMRNSVSVQTAEVMKINDQIMHGLAFHKGDEPAPTFYLDELFEIYQRGEDPKEILRGLVDTYVDCYAHEDAGNEEVPIPAETPDLSYKSIRKRIGVRLLGMDYNKKFLETVPYRDVGNGYALVSEIQVEASDDGVFSTVITNAMAEEYHYDMKRVFDTALENAWRTNAASFVRAEELMNGDDLYEEAESCWVLSTSRQRFGATALFYPGTQAMIADVLNEDYIAIPSSLHEFIIVRKSVISDSHHLRQLVKEANRIIVRPEDVLSDNILYYCKSSQSISVL